MSELKPISAIDAAKFLREASRYFDRRPTGGDDAAFWANVANAETCIRIAEMLERVFDIEGAA